MKKKIAKRVYKEKKGIWSCNVEYQDVANVAKKIKKYRKATLARIRTYEQQKKLLLKLYESQMCVLDDCIVGLTKDVKVCDEKLSLLAKSK